MGDTSQLEIVRDTMVTLVAAAWGYYAFHLKRERSPKLRLHHTIVTLPMPDKAKVHLRVTVRLENLGQTLIPLRCIRTDVNQLRPWPEHIEASLTSGERTMADNSSELPWTTLSTAILDFSKSRREIEPGEDDQFTFDFILKHPLEVVSLYTYVPNITKPITIKSIRQEYKEIGWSITTTHTLTQNYEPKQTVNETRASENPQ